MIENCRALLVIAQELLESGRVERNELKYRSAVNRAYYSVFLLAREKTKLEIEVHDVHSKVFREMSHRLIRIGKQSTVMRIKELREYRQQADYSFPTTLLECEDWRKCAENAVIQAGFALNHLERL